MFLHIAPPSLVSELRFLAPLSTDLPGDLNDGTGLGYEDRLERAVSLTERFPKSARAWEMRGRCETRAGYLDKAVRSYQRAEKLGLPNGAGKLRKASASFGTARRWRTLGQIVAALDEGGGYWLIREKGSGLYEADPSGKANSLNGASSGETMDLGTDFGIRRLEGMSKPALIVEGYRMMSNGGSCNLFVFGGGPGHWKEVLQRQDLLWDVPIIDLNHDGQYELAIRDWVWYKGPTWINVFRCEKGDFRQQTRRYPWLIRRQLATIRRPFPTIRRAGGVRLRF